jgi:hypothetical protein
VGGLALCVYAKLLSIPEFLKQGTQLNKIFAAGNLAQVKNFFKLPYVHRPSRRWSCQAQGRWLNQDLSVDKFIF